MQVDNAETASNGNSPATDGGRKRKASRADLEDPTRGMPSPVIAEPTTPHSAVIADHSPAFTVDSNPGLTSSPALSTQSHPPPLTPGFTYAFENDSAAAAAGEDDGSEEGEEGKKVVRRKIRIEYIQDKSRRHITFSKRKAGIMKKAYELATLTGTQVLLLVVSETGLVYTFTTTKLQPLVTQTEGKNLIQACLNTRDGESPSFHGNSDVDDFQPKSKFQPSAPVQGGQVALKAKPAGVRDRRGSASVGGPRLIRRASMPQPHLGPLPPPAPPMSTAPSVQYPYKSHRMPQHPFASPGGLHIAGLGLDSPLPSPMTGFDREMTHHPLTPGIDGMTTSNTHMHPSIMPHSAFHYANDDVHYVHGPEHSPDTHYAMHAVPQPIPMYLPPQPTTPGHHHHLQHLSSPMTGEPMSPHPSPFPHHGPVIDYGGLTLSPHETNGPYSTFDHHVDQHTGTPIQSETPLSTTNGQQDYFLTQPVREEDA